MTHERWVEMAAYLVEHPPTRSQFRNPRRQEPSGVVVVHTAENAPDFVAFDGGAEAVARFIQGRSDAGSYHDLCDSDSCINLVPYDAEAYQDGTGSNPHAYSVSVATRADVWPLAPPAWRDGAVEQSAQAAARFARWFYARRGIVIPARRITRDQSERRIPGFISHGERDPGRRRDPGAEFPWEQFLARYAQLTADLGEPVEEEEMPRATYIRRRDRPEVYLAGIAIAPRHVALFKAAEWHAAREGLVIVDAATPQPSAAEDVTDGEGTTRKVMVVDDGTMFGIGP